uniref:Uncharacterized protein n=1 Tax=viral metagenome TaxID=1070528 RepID=A0A6H1ZV68_9ZZZZ
MGWFDWVREFGEAIGEAIETGLRGVFDLPGEIRPVIPERPASLELIEELVAETAFFERFVGEVTYGEAIRLSRGVPFYERLKNVARMRHWTVMDPRDIVPDMQTQISLRRVYVGPDGAVTYVDIAFGYGERYNEDEALRKSAAALDEEWVERYDVGRSQLARDYLVAEGVYMQRHKPL